MLATWFGDIRGCPDAGDAAPRSELVKRLDRRTRALSDARRAVADRDREISKLRNQSQKLEDALDDARAASRREAEATRRRVAVLERAVESGDFSESSRRRPASRGAERRRREHSRKAASDRCPPTDVSRIHSLRDSLETLRLHPAERERVFD